MAGTELVVIETPDDAIEAMRGNLVVPIQDPKEIQRQMMESIFDTANPDDILGTNTAVHAEQIIGRAFSLNGVKYLKSKYKDGLPVFAVMEVTFGDDGSTAAVTCSATRVCAQAAMLWKLDALPKTVMIQRAEEPTANGYYPMWLEAA